ncbi:MAG: Sec-independent protein translocase protein TatB [Pseudomonadota bacterium]|nr:Sec-independent protein translocase protein TatB [Pseudomonadota bacterium]MDP1572840.1 Sec-independent protein translocase protein TatB [Pseudomonadota bacterium]MDP1903457.1 Sec-independent protein translocase protein TatB [Pseudomonadota bacterium]
MFDLAFSELLIIGIVALVVIGPERLPKVARTAGQWVGKLNRYVSQVKQDIDRDMKLDELRKMQQDMKDTAQRYEIMAKDGARVAEETVEEGANQISKVMQAMSATDGGLTMKEWDKVKEEDAAKLAAALPEEPAALADAPAPIEAAPVSTVSEAPAIPPVPPTSTDGKADDRPGNDVKSV